MTVDLTCACGPWLLVVHPTDAVRRQVLAATPDWVRTRDSARLDDPALAEPAVGLVVVALDPARTSPAQVVAPAGDGPGRPARLHLLSISDLHLDVPDPAVDSTLPRRRLTRTSLARHLRGIGAEVLPCPHRAHGPLAGTAGPRTGATS